MTDLERFIGEVSRRLRSDLENGTATFDGIRCRFCRRYVVDGTYTRIAFPDGIALVCDLCREKADEPNEDVIEWRGADVEVV